MISFLLSPEAAELRDNLREARAVRRLLRPAALHEGFIHVQGSVLLLWKVLLCLVEDIQGRPSLLMYHGKKHLAYRESGKWHLHWQQRLSLLQSMPDMTTVALSAGLPGSIIWNLSVSVQQLCAWQHPSAGGWLHLHLTCKYCAS